MRGGGKLFMVGGIGLGLIAVVLAVLAFTAGGGGEDESDAPKAAVAAQVTVVETLLDIPAHTLLNVDDVIEVKVADTGLAADSIRTRAEVIGLAYRQPLVKGQRLVASLIEQPGLANDIAPGLRAMPIKADEAHLLSGLVQDDDYIDIVYKARINEVRLLSHVIGPLAEDETAYKIENDDEFGWTTIDITDEFPPHPPAGDPGSQMFIRDDVGEDQQLEPVAKVILQDLHVLRVVRPGEKFGANGQPLTEPVVEGAEPEAEDGLPGYLIVEVTNQQAELLAFIQDEKHAYSVVVRGKDDHQTVNTTGVTFEILATNGEYGLPLPGSVTAASGLPAPGEVVMPEALADGDYRSGVPVTLPDPPQPDPGQDQPEE